MKKKAVFKIIIFTLIILIILLGGLLFSEKSGLIENIGNIRSKKIEEKEITRIDVTDLEDGGSVTHEHTFKTMYNENEHWEECTVCGEINNKNTHSYKTTWASGSASCEKNNYYTNTCSCGYSFIGHIPCRWDGKTYTSGSSTNSFVHIKKCSVCKGQISYSYYGPDNILYPEEGELSKVCKQNGKTLDCNNLGTCSICKKIYNKAEHLLATNENNEIYCITCNNKYGTAVTKFEEISTAPATYKITSEVNLTNGATFSKVGAVRNVGSAYSTNSMAVSNKNSNGTSYTLNCTATFKSTWKTSYWTYIHSYVYINGVEIQLNCEYVSGIMLPPDSIKPEITSIKMGDGNDQLVEWSRTKPIIVSGTENYCDTVKVKILDENGETVFSGEAGVSNKNFSISCVPELELDINGKMFTLIVTDACENSVEQTFNIAKVDAIAPVPKSDTEILGDWAKSKKFTFRATDVGIGEVQIAFNDIEDLSLANFDGTEYSRDYEFYGDVYEPKQLSVLYRDGLGNTSMQKIVIDKIDNTEPTIVNANIHNNVVSVEAHDRHERLGEGSGIVKYRYIVSSEKLTNPDVSSGIEIDVNEKKVIDDVYKVKYVYVVAEDAVGNISEVYELKVPELILTSSVDLSLANGKGGVILDWSTYDVSDKYFVVYRKEENATEWETIVSLDKKLTGSTYTDILGNDKNKPDVPNINIIGDVQNNSIKIEATSNDNGSKYTYYIEAYDSLNLLISVSKKN